MVRLPGAATCCINFINTDVHLFKICGLEHRLPLPGRACCSTKIMQCAAINLTRAS